MQVGNGFSGSSLPRTTDLSVKKIPSFPIGSASDAEHADVSQNAPQKAGSFLHRFEQKCAVKTHVQFIYVKVQNFSMILG